MMPEIVVTLQGTEGSAIQSKVFSKPDTDPSAALSVPEKLEKLKKDTDPEDFTTFRHGEVIKNLYSTGCPIYRRVKGEDNTWPYKELSSMEACRESDLLTARKKPGTRIFFKDGDTFSEIDNEHDFERAAVLKGVSDESLLSAEEKKALPILQRMLDRGAVFREQKMMEKKGERVGLLSVMKALGGHIEGVDYWDSSMRKSVIKSVKDLERIDHVYYRDKDSRITISPRERSLIRQTLELMKKGVRFEDSVFDEALGAPMVVKAALQEDRGLHRDNVSFIDEAGRHAHIDSADDLRKIRAIYVNKDISGLPEEEQKIIDSLKRLYDRKGDEAPPITMNLLASLKSILAKDSFGVPIGVNGEDPEKLSNETIRTLKDIGRYVALYLDRDRAALPPDEREAVDIIDSLRASGIEFVGTLKSRVMSMGILQVLKGEHPFDRSVGLQPEGSLPRINRMEDLKRLDALLIKKDPSLLRNDEDRILQRILELEKCGITFRGAYDKSVISVIKCLKGETRIAFMVHPDGKESMINELTDLDRIKALYMDKDPSSLPTGEAEMIEDIQGMLTEGYSCTLAHGGRLKEVKSFDVLKSSIRNYPNVGLMDRAGAFTSISSAADMKNLKALQRGEEPASLNAPESELFKKIHYLMDNGYSFKAHLEFWPENAPVLFSPEADDYKIGPLQLLKEFRKGNENIWAVKDGETIPISNVIDVMDSIEKVRQTAEDVAVASPEDTIIEGDDYVIVAGVKLSIKKS